MNEKQRISVLKNLDIWKSGRISIAPLRGGFTNHNYLVTDKNKKYVARFAPETTKLLHLNRKSEIYNYNVAARLGIGPKTTVYHPQHRLLIVEYLDGKVLKPKTARGPVMIKKIAKILKTLHNGPRLKNLIDPMNRGQGYTRLARRFKTWMPKHMDQYLEHLKLIEKRLGKLPRTYPCHLDIMIANVIITPTDTIKLIDWEYSSNADYRYDLSMLSVKGKFRAVEDRLLVRAYTGRDDEKLYSDIQLMKAVVYFAEAAYGILQNALSDKSVNYKKYALMNLRGFEKITQRMLKDA